MDRRYTPSVISSHMTDIASEDGEEYHRDGAGPAATQSHGALPTNPPSRPTSAQQDTWSRPPGSRRGGMPSTSVSSWRTPNAFVGPVPSTSSVNSRPQSATSRTSRTHVPSLTSHAFFRPMSSQRLQAQRGGRPSTAGQTEDTNGGLKASIYAGKRRSLGSNAGPIIENVDDDLPPPPSRGTNFSENEPLDRRSINASPTGHNTIQSTGESTRPLRGLPLTGRQSLSEHTQDFNAFRGQSKPTGSFRSSFLLPMRRDISNHAESNLHVDRQPSSDMKTEYSTPGKSSPRSGRLPSKNYHHFSGNTAFFWGGRLQNTKDRPINIATGTLVVLPSILFLVFA
jgi:palmitoyltransferase ZDHHC9/14/18